MTTVTRRAKDAKQPRGGYLNPKIFKKTELGGRPLPANEENVHASIVGLAVDYLARVNSGTDPLDAFDASLRGAARIGETENALRLCRDVTSLDGRSVAAACMLSGYDVCYRSSPASYVPVETIRPDATTVASIKEMAERTLRFLERYGPKTLDGFDLEGGYTDVVNAGDGDFLTRDALWDVKVSVNPPTKEHTLQILMYWLMGRHSVHPEFQDISSIGIYNPRLDIAWTMAVAEIPRETVEAVERDVIGYQEDDRMRGSKSDNEPPKMDRVKKSMSESRKMLVDVLMHSDDADELGDAVLCTAVTLREVRMALEFSRANMMKLDNASLETDATILDMIAALAEAEAAASRLWGEL